MKVQAIEDIYDSDGVLLYRQGDDILGAISGAENGLFVDYQYQLPFSPCEYTVIDEEETQIALACDSDPSDYLHVEFDDGGDSRTPNNQCIYLSVYSGAQMLGGVTLYEKAKLQELIQFLQDAIAE